MMGAVYVFLSSIVLPVSTNQWPRIENCFSKGVDDDSFYYFCFSIVRMVLAEIVLLRNNAQDMNSIVDSLTPLARYD
jgi:hypothetical protein